MTAAGFAAVTAFAGILTAPAPATDNGLGDFRGAEWRLLPSLPRARGAMRPSGIVAVGDRLYVVLNYELQKSSRAVIWRWNGNRWVGPVGGRTFTVDQKFAVEAVNNGQLCINTLRAAVARVYCLKGQRWQQLGGTVYEPSAGSYMGDFTALGKALFVTADTLADAATGPGGVVSGRPQATPYTLGEVGWQPAAPDVAAEPGGSQRATGFAYLNQFCLAFNSLPDPQITLDPRAIPASPVGPNVRVRCLQDQRWNDVGEPIMPAPDQKIDVDGAAALGESRYIGIDQYQRTGGTNWAIYRSVGDRWLKTSLGESNSHWSGQGNLSAIDGKIWAVRFDQRFTHHGLVARLLVRVFDPATGKVVPVGRPLLRKAVLYDFPSNGLARSNGQIYAIHTLPDAKRRRNVTRVSRLVLKHKPQR